MPCCLHVPPGDNLSAVRLCPTGENGLHRSLGHSRGCEQTWNQFPRSQHSCEIGRGWGGPSTWRTLADFVSSSPASVSAVFARRAYQGSGLNVCQQGILALVAYASQYIAGCKASLVTPLHLHSDADTFRSHLGAPCVNQSRGGLCESFGTSFVSALGQNPPGAEEPWYRDFTGDVRAHGSPSRLQLALASHNLRDPHTTSCRLCAAPKLDFGIPRPGSALPLQSLDLTSRPCVLHSGVQTLGDGSVAPALQCQHISLVHRSMLVWAIAPQLVEDIQDFARLDPRTKTGRHRAGSVARVDKVHSSAYIAGMGSFRSIASLSPGLPLVALTLPPGSSQVCQRRASYNAVQATRHLSTPTRIRVCVLLPLVAPSATGHGSVLSLSLAVLSRTLQSAVFTSRRFRAAPFRSSLEDLVKYSLTVRWVFATLRYNIVNSYGRIGMSVPSAPTKPDADVVDAPRFRRPQAHGFSLAISLLVLVARSLLRTSTVDAIDTPAASRRPRITLQLVFGVPRPVSVLSSSLPTPSSCSRRAAPVSRAPSVAPLSPRLASSPSCGDGKPSCSRSIENASCCFARLKAVLGPPELNSSSLRPRGPHLSVLARRPLRILSSLGLHHARLRMLAYTQFGIHCCNVRDRYFASESSHLTPLVAFSLCCPGSRRSARSDTWNVRLIWLGALGFARMTPLHPYALEGLAGPEHQLVHRTVAILRRGVHESARVRVFGSRNSVDDGSALARLGSRGMRVCRGIGLGYHGVEITPTHITCFVLIVLHGIVNSPPLLAA
ncbi:hypothetical protein FOMPIDRAFT_1018383 [Fomitopsis schrenkii]|uniref:Uncharacterized protein n=1 Tax=Fomitopsis schrenkii TaxID=2126942 RepID=S8DW25_FOMSC|nr:hypothetical protein FOMPIDRAFT_1018383 [Fomitopsis schrenkii]